MSDDRFKRYFEGIQRELRTWLVDYKILGVSFSKDALAAKLQFATKDMRSATESIQHYLNGRLEVDDRWSTNVVRNTIQIKVHPKPEEEPKGIPFSSPDEERGTEPIEIAQMFVRKEIDKTDPEPTPEYTTYVVWFAYILGGWKALISTTFADGRYYEVTYNKNNDEFYVDTYLKIVNTTYHAEGTEQ